jgi:uncharacterized membrane protein
LQTTPDTFGSSTVRIEALSDAVLAIAMTLLILDLHPPAHAPGALRHELLSQWPAYVSFLASFLYIAVIWANHHAAFQRITTIDRPLAWANIAIILGAVLLPFPTSVLAGAFRDGNRADERAAIVLYGGIAVMMSASWMTLFWLLHRRNPHIDPAMGKSWRAQARRPLTGIAGYLAGIGLSLLVHPALGLTILAIPVYYAVTSEGLSHRSLLPQPAGRLLRGLAATPSFESNAGEPSAEGYADHRWAAFRNTWKK